MSDAFTDDDLQSIKLQHEYTSTEYKKTCKTCQIIARLEAAEKVESDGEYALDRLEFLWSVCPVIFMSPRGVHPDNAEIEYLKTPEGQFFKKAIDQLRVSIQAWRKAAGK